MTINQIVDAINTRAITNGKTPTFGTDFSGHYDISATEAQRIAARANSLDEFEAIWNNKTDWRD